MILEIQLVHDSQPLIMESYSTCCSLGLWGLELCWLSKEEQAEGFSRCYVLLLPCRFLGLNGTKRAGTPLAMWLALKSKSPTHTGGSSHKRGVSKPGDVIGDKHRDKDQGIEHLPIWNPLTVYCDAIFLRKRLGRKSSWVATSHATTVKVPRRTKFTTKSLQHAKEVFGIC